MAKAKKKDLNSLTLSQLGKLKEDLLLEKRTLLFDRAIATVENPARIREVRREIARVNTICKEIELNIREEPKQK